MSLLTLNLDGGMTDAGLSLAPFGSLLTQSGVLKANAFLVKALASPGMFVEVTGSTDDDIAIIKTADGATYYVKNTLTFQVPILANSSGVTKTDAIVLYVDLSDGDASNAGSPGSAHVIAVRRDGVSTGTPTNGEIDAATFSNPWLLLRQVVLPHGKGQVEETDLGYSPTRPIVRSSLLEAVYPVGSIYMNATSNTNPATLFGFGSWSAFGAGRVLVGFDSGQTEFNAAEKTGGEKTHVLTVPELPAHNHSITTKTGTTGAVNQIAGQTNTGGASQTADTAVMGNTGSSGAHNNLQPYIAVYMWKRTA